MYPLKNATAITIPFFAHDANGDGVTGIADGSFTKRISKNGGAFAAMTVTITEMENGWYSLPVSTSHSDTNGILTISLSASGAKRINLQFRVSSRIDDDLCYPAISGRAIDVDSTGGVEITANQNVNVNQWLGSAVATPTVAGVPEVDVTHWIGTAAATPDTAGHPKVTIKDGSGAGEINLTSGTIDAVTTVTTTTNVTNAVTVGTINAGVITATAIATGAIDADAIAADAVTEIRSVVSGTADSGTTTTLVDAARTEADTDYWRGCTLLMTSGTIAGESRIITAFNPATDTITVDRAFTQAVGTQTYEILPCGPALLAATTHTSATVPTVTDVTNGVAVASIAANAITASAIATNAIDADAMADGAITAATFAAGAIDATAIASDAITAAKIANGAIDAATFAAGAIDAASIATGAITAAKFAAGAIDATAIANGAIDAATFAAGAIDATAIANGAIDAATFAAGAIDAAALATDAVNEIADGLLDRNMATGTDSGSPTVRTVRQALRFSRNRINIAGGTLTCYKEDDSTASWTAAVTTTAGNPITQVDPAS